MPDDDDTVRQQATLRGVQKAQDVGNAATLAHPSQGDSSPAAPRASGPLGDGRYTLGEMIGEGGMGEVLAAMDQRFTRPVAIKRIRALNPSPEEESRFMREALVQGRLQHPAVVPVHDISVGAERPYFVMKRLTGTAMSELLRKLRDHEIGDEASARRRMLRAFTDVCNAVAFAHQQGIIHRDLKPANIMLGEFGEVYVLDWGIARAVTEPDDTGTPPSGQHDLKLSTGDTRQGTVLGTPAYMAPEQLAGDRAGPASDIYALGCILYEIAAGVPLHSKLRPIGAALMEIDTNPSTRRAESPPELDAICTKACAIEASARYDTPQALGNAVQAYLDGDRDLAARKDLAQKHLAEARAEVAKGDGEEHRRNAIRAAGRALALDPTTTEAGDLVTRLMLEPPAMVPEEVERSLEAHDTESARSQGRLAAISMIGYLAFIPILLWTGVRDLTLIPVFGIVAALSGLQIFALTRTSSKIPPAAIYLNVCVNAVLIGIVCRLVGPLIIAPTLVTTTMVAYCAHPQLGRVHIVATILASGVVIPWVLEVVGVLEKTYHFVGGTIVLTSPSIRFSAAPVQVAFAVLLVILPAIVAVLSRGLARRQRDAARKLELQAWHLRQIVPS